VDVGGGAIDPFRILGAYSRVKGNLFGEKCWDNGIHDLVSLRVSVALGDLNDPRERAPAMKSVSSWPSCQISNSGLLLCWHEVIKKYYYRYSYRYRISTLI
jgi:hypothetical protein